MQHILPELLSPAGGEAALRAAVDSGANAVYLGYSAFGARASAANFDAEALENAVRYAHLYGVRVHVTVNTLVKPMEARAVYEALETIAHAGADAVLTQDIGVAQMVRSDFPTLALHASTQMALCSRSGAEWAKRFGFQRVVLARECSLDEIRAVAACGIETEVFAHGALCSAVSGRCLMSSMAGGRSGNRGRCAQPCRQIFRLAERGGALLSLKDLCFINDLPALIEAGVCSLKIEGRLKSPEYVAVVTSVYRKALDDIATGRYTPGDPAAMEALAQVFNRGGFTRGHAMSAEDADLCTGERVGHAGVPLGTVERVKDNLAIVRLVRPINDGDSLQLRLPDMQDADTRYAGHGANAGESAVVRLRPGMRAFVGQEVARLSDARQLEEARAHAPRKIPVRLSAAFAVGKPMRLMMTDGQVTAEAEGTNVEAAKNRATTREEALKQLLRLGDTPFTAIGTAELDMGDGLFLPVSALNALRRECTEKLIEERIRAMARQPRRATCSDISKHTRSEACPPIEPATFAIAFSDAAMAERLAAAAVPTVPMLIYEPRDLRSPDDMLVKLPRGTWLSLPPQTPQDTLSALMKAVEARRELLGGVVLNSVGQLDLPIPLARFLGSGVPVTNREGMLALANEGVCGFTLWPEWSHAEQCALTPFTMPPLLTMYGRETLMLLNHCPERVARRLNSHRAACTICTNGHMACGREDAALTDRKGYRFPLVRTIFPGGCELSVLNALPTDLRAYDAERRALGAGMLIRFTDEPAKRQSELTAVFAALSRGDAPNEAALPSSEPSTAGHWRRGVE